MNSINSSINPGVRPPSARPGSASRLASAARPGTATRPGTGRIGTPGGQKLAPHVGKRTIINQGLGGITASTKGTGREIADKPYYVAELRQRIGDLNAEIEKMTQEIEQFERDNQASLSLERKIESLSGEINLLQGQLTDYNFILDKIHTSTSGLDMDSIAAQAEALKTKNEDSKRIVDQIFTDRSEKEQRIQEIEQQVNQIQQETEKQLKQLDPTQLESFKNLRQGTQTLLAEAARLQVTMDELNKESLKLEEELHSDSSKQKALQLHDELYHLQKQKTELEEELGQTQLSVPEEIDRLTQKVKQANSDVANADQQTSETLDAINKIREQMSQVEKQMVESKSDRAEKFKELMKKDKDMTGFIEKYESDRKEHITKNSKFETSNVQLLENISKLLHREQYMPSLENFQQMQSALQYKESQVSAAQTTTQKLQEELAQRKMELQKMSSLDSKIAEEAVQLKEGMQKMKEELKSFLSIDTVKMDYETTKQKVTYEKQALQKRKELLGQQNQLLSAECDAKEKQLRDDEMHSQLEVLEKSLKHYQQNNFNIATKGKESDYKSMVPEIMNIVGELNSIMATHAQV